MNLWQIAWRYIWRRSLVSLLTMLGIALGTALICSVLTLKRETGEVFRQEAAVFDLIVGAKGSPLQLTLSTLYHLDVPTGNINKSVFDDLAQDRRVTNAVPVSIGDNYKGFRIVGTNAAFFDLPRYPHEADQNQKLVTMQTGRVFEAPFEVVLGAMVAARTGLRIGDTFVGSHGLVDSSMIETHDEHPYEVVGVLSPSMTANDRAIFTPLESIWQVHEHEKPPMSGTLFSSSGDEHVHEEEHGHEEGHEHNHEGDENHAHDESESEEEITAVLVQLNSPGQRLFVADEINRQTDAMAAIPLNQMLRLYQQVLAPVQSALLAIAYVVVFVSALTIITTLYQAAERRRRDIALMRTLGAYRREITSLLMLEASFLTIMGIISGWVLGHLAVSIGFGLMQNSMGMAFQAWSIDALEIRALASIAVVGLVAGLIPGLLAYRRSPVRDLNAM